MKKSILTFLFISIIFISGLVGCSLEQALFPDVAPYINAIIIVAGVFIIIGIINALTGGEDQKIPKAREVIQDLYDQLLSKVIQIII